MGCPALTNTSLPSHDTESGCSAVADARCPRHKAQSPTRAGAGAAETAAAALAGAPQQQCVGRPLPQGQTLGISSSSATVKLPNLESRPTRGGPTWRAIIAEQLGRGKVRVNSDSATLTPRRNRRSSLRPRSRPWAQLRASPARQDCLPVRAAFPAAMSMAWCLTQLSSSCFCQALPSRLGAVDACFPQLCVRAALPSIPRAHSQ